MKNALKPILFVALAVWLLASCTVSGPLYGTWADNRGNTLAFFDDHTFNARINTPGGVHQNYNGNFTLLLNVLTMDCNDIDLRVVTEWDIRGNILYLSWTMVDGSILSLTLFKISN